MNMSAIEDLATSISSKKPLTSWTRKNFKVFSTSRLPNFISLVNDLVLTKMSKVESQKKSQAALGKRH